MDKDTLIIFLLSMCQNNYIDSSQSGFSAINSNPYIGKKEFIYKGTTYLVEEKYYKFVCEIVDCIKKYRNKVSN